MEHGKRYAVFSVRRTTDKNGTAVWVRCGIAWANRDGSANVALDAVPLDGKLHIREAGEKREYAGSAHGAPAEKGPNELMVNLQSNVQSMGGH